MALWLPLWNVKDFGTFLRENTLPIINAARSTLENMEELQRGKKKKFNPEPKKTAITTTSSFTCSV